MSFGPRLGIAIESKRLLTEKGEKHNMIICLKEDVWLALKKYYSRFKNEISASLKIPMKDAMNHIQRFRTIQSREQLCTIQEFLSEVAELNDKENSAERKKKTNIKSENSEAETCLDADWLILLDFAQYVNETLFREYVKNNEKSFER